MIEVEDENRSVVRVDMLDKTFNSQMMEVFQGSNLNEIMDEMLPHMRTQVKNPMLVNSRLVFN